MIHQGDCLNFMRTLEPESVKIIVTSPPYNLINSSGNGIQKPGRIWKNPPLRFGYDNYSDAIPRADYINWQRECLAEMMRILRTDGAIFYNHKFRVQHGLIQDHHEILSGLPVRQQIVWQRSGGVNFNDRFFLPTYEIIYLIAKPDFKLLPKKNLVGDVWKFRQDQANPHPAPFPVELPTRCISSVGDGLVFDPFLGSGTTALAAERLGREWIGIDLSPKYCAMALERIQQEKCQLKLF